jgi:hypothetical protein
MSEFFTMITKILMYPPFILTKGADALNAYNFDKTLLSEYLSYFHYAVGTPIFILFTSLALIAIAISIWSLVVKAIALIMEIIPFA